MARVIEITGLVAGIEPSVDTADFNRQLRLARQAGYCKGMDNKTQRAIVRCPAAIPGASKRFTKVLCIMRWIA